MVCGVWCVMCGVWCVVCDEVWVRPVQHTHPLEELEAQRVHVGAGPVHHSAHNAREDGQVVRGALPGVQVALGGGRGGRRHLERAEVVAGTTRVALALVVQRHGQIGHDVAQPAVGRDGVEGQGADSAAGCAQLSTGQEGRREGGREAGGHS